MPHDSKERYQQLALELGWTEEVFERDWLAIPKLTRDLLDDFDQRKREALARQESLAQAEAEHARELEEASELQRRQARWESIRLVFILLFWVALLGFGAVISLRLIYKFWIWLWQ